MMASYCPSRLYAITLLFALLWCPAAAAQQLSGDISLGDADVIFRGGAPGLNAGLSLSSAGDINDDGFDDLVLGAQGGAMLQGTAHVFYGGAGADLLSGLLDLSTADATFPAGQALADARDFNNDGVSDLIIGTGNVNSRTGESYLLYGAPGTGAPSGDLTLSDADVVFEGIAAGDSAGFRVTSPGDVNGDLIDDLLIAATPLSSSGSARVTEVYLIYGQSGVNALGGSFDLTGADATILQATPGSTFPNGNFNEVSISGAGDFNNDGLKDFAIGVPTTNPLGQLNAGSTYLFYGSPGADPLSGDLGLEADADVVFEGVEAFRESGGAVVSPGDVNGDGIDDLLIPSREGGPGRPNGSGLVRLFYGREGVDQLEGTLSLSEADAAFAGAPLDIAGVSVSPAGDVNGDGLDDFLIGANMGNRAYLVYGRSGAEEHSGDIDLSTQADAVFTGFRNGDQAGLVVSAAGDVNGDGLDDLLIAAPFADRGGLADIGEAYLIYGRPVPEPNGVAVTGLLLGCFIWKRRLSLHRAHPLPGLGPLVL